MSTLLGRSVCMSVSLYVCRKNVKYCQTQGFVIMLAYKCTVTLG